MKYEIQILNTDGKTWRKLKTSGNRKSAKVLKRYYISFFGHKEKIRFIKV